LGLHEILVFFLGGGVTVAVIVTTILANPEKTEKWFALFWKAVNALGIGLRFAHKKYVQHDFQGSVNEFVKKHSNEMPGFQVKGVRLDWVDAEINRKAFIEADRVVVRVKRNDPHHENFVKAVYLFVSTSLLYRAKRYISLPQGRAIDLFVSAEIFKEQKPEVVDYFLETYLHPHIDDGSARVTQLFEKFDVISKGGFFFPVFLQEMDYLGQKVFGRGKSQEIVTEVDALVEFLRAISLRRIGEDSDLNFAQQYCRFGIVIVGKAAKVSQSITPYVNFIREGLRRENLETIYLIGRSENEEAIKQVCTELSDAYDVVAKKRTSKIVLYGNEKKRLKGFVAVLRSKNRPLYISTKGEL
jgi:hypothetical protein